MNSTNFNAGIRQPTNTLAIYQLSINSTLHCLLLQANMRYWSITSLPWRIEVRLVLINIAKVGYIKHKNTRDTQCIQCEILIFNSNNNYL